MSEIRLQPRPASDKRRPIGIAFVAVAALSIVLASTTFAGGKTPYQARNGLDVANAAAKAWSDDAILVYIENDETIGADGTSVRWGYLYYSPRTEIARVYSVRDNKILVAENLDMLFDAPPISNEWIDSGRALAVAEAVAGRSYRDLHRGKLSTMLLMRGAFHSGDPDQTTWTLIYTAPGEPSLFVVVDAHEGKVSRTWRG